MQPTLGRGRAPVSVPADTVPVVGRILFSQPGAAAVMALRTVLDEVRAGDRLAPVDVIVPTGVAGVSVRRAVAGDDGLAKSKLESTRLLYVALTRAMDHLVVGCYYKQSRNGQKSHAQKVWDLLSNSVLAVNDPISAGSTIEAATEPLPTDAGGSLTISLPGRDEFARARDELLVAVNARVATSPTALVKEALVTAAVEEAAIGEANEQAAAEDVTTAGDVTPKKYPRRWSNKGAAIGTAVHRVLELVDLANPIDDET